MKLLQQAQALYKKVEQRFAQRELTRHRDVLAIPHDKIGTDYGGWFVPGGLLSQQSLCYGVGAGEDISFEIGLIKRYGCEVFSFDPTPRARRHIELLRTNTARGIPTPVNQSERVFYECDQGCLDRLHFHPYGVWSEDRIMRFYSPSDPTHVSHSIVNLQRTETYFEAECRTVNGLMRTFGHEELCLLKLDVEGAEYEVLRSLLDGVIRPRILCVEFDEGFQPVDDEYLDRILSHVQRLKTEDYLLTYLDRWNLTFVHRSVLSGTRQELTV
jgi:FkbM family methyltransferase